MGHGPGEKPCPQPSVREPRLVWPEAPDILTPILRPGLPTSSGRAQSAGSTEAPLPVPALHHPGQLRQSSRGGLQHGGLLLGLSGSPTPAASNSGCGAWAQTGVQQGQVQRGPARVRVATVRLCPSQCGQSCCDRQVQAAARSTGTAAGQTLPQAGPGWSRGSPA